jgi:hypothetical protein
VEPVEPQGLDVIAPLSLQADISVSEMFRLCFGDTVPVGAERVTIESDWIERLDRLAAKRRATMDARFPSGDCPKWPSDLQMPVNREMRLANGTHRFLSAEKDIARYMVCTFLVTVVSDEKRESLISLCLNESNGMIADHLVQAFQGWMEQHGHAQGSFESDEVVPTAWTSAEIAEHAGMVLGTRVRKQMEPFFKAMARRLNRDQDRVHSYHVNLYAESRRVIEEKVAKGLKEEEIARERLRLSSVEREYKAKIADLRHKYEVTIEARPVQMIRVVAPVIRCRLSILRRKGIRPLHLDVNPFSRRIDNILCEACGGFDGVFTVCDDKLHLTCQACQTPCAECGKSWCRACSTACPRC